MTKDRETHVAILKALDEAKDRFPALTVGLLVDEAIRAHARGELERRYISDDTLLEALISYISKHAKLAELLQ